tara:strand:- start:1782 stop:2213 length:432 start_codon:yes stop_codon:yes gene_type:complete
MFNSCTLSDEQLLNEIEQTERIEIKRTFYGGIGGSGGIDYTLKRSGYFEEENDWVLIRDEGTQFQTYILLDSSQINTFRLFVREAIKSHDSNREYYRTCDSSSPSQYDIRIGSYSRHLQPDNETDSIFYSLIKEFCLGKHIFE